MKLAVQVNNDEFNRLTRALTKATPRKNAQAIVGRALLAAAYRIQEVATRDYMSGPRPLRIDVVTDRLRGSISVSRGRLPWQVSVGTNVVYGPVHELGSRKRHTPARPYLQPATRDVSPEVPELILRAWERAAEGR